jgi:hypothetical protein
MTPQGWKIHNERDISEPIMFATRDKHTYCAAGFKNCSPEAYVTDQCCPAHGEPIETGYYFPELPHVKFCLSCGEEIAKYRAHGYQHEKDRLEKNLLEITKG